MQTKLRTALRTEGARALILATFGVALALLTASLAHAGESSKREERTDRVVDEASADTQGEAERELVSTVSEYRGTPREVELLLRLSELRLEIAETTFRVDFASPEAGGKASAVKTQSSRGAKSLLTRAENSLSRILTEFPKASEYARALFLHGKVSAMLDKSPRALADLTEFLNRFPSRPEAGLAAMSIADLSMEKKDYRRAIAVLGPLVKSTSNPFYAMALRKRAWSFHLDGNSLRAVNELSTASRYFNSKSEKNPMTTGEGIVLDGILTEASSIAYAAHVSQPASYSMVQANQLFWSLDQGEAYRAMAAQFSSHLRADDASAKILEWKRLVLKTDPSKKNHLPMLVGIFDYQLGREAYVDAAATAREIADVVATLSEQDEAADSAKEAKNLVVKAADRLTKRIVDYRGTPKSQNAEATLLALLPSMDLMLGANDVRRMAIRWNLGETFFSLKRYDAATKVYRWIYTNWNGTKSSEDARLKAISPVEAGLKAVVARYESLKAAGIGSQEVKAVGAVLHPNIGPQNLAATREWINWVDELAANPKAAGNSEAVEHYPFEAIRVLYLLGFQAESMKRATDFALAKPSSDFAVPAASLVLDTWTARANWTEVEGNANAFASASKWKVSTFPGKLREQASAARMKRAELAFAAKDFKGASEHASYYLKTYPNGPSALDAKGIACNSALQGREFTESVTCFQQLAVEFPKAPAAREAVRTAAEVDDERFNFLAASVSYERYLGLSAAKLTKTENEAIRYRILRLARASGNVSAMRAAASKRANCTPSARLMDECAIDQAVAAFLEGSAATRSRAAKLATTAPKNLRPLWATLALEDWTHLQPKTLETLLSTLVKNWDDADVSMRYLMIPRLVATIPAALATEREHLRDANLAANAPSILARIRRLQNWEARTAMVAKLPLNRLRAASFEQSHLAYADLVAELRALPAPPKATPEAKRAQDQLIAKMSEPFVLKARKLRDQFVSLQSQGRSGIDVSPFDEIWEQGPKKPSLASFTLQKEWPKALKSEDWSRVGYFSDESASLPVLSKEWVKAARAVSLAKSGAEAEAKLLFADACRANPADARLRDTCRTAIHNGKERS